MADDPEDKPSGGGGRGAAVSAFLKKKTGPLPNGAWVFIAAAVLFYMYKRNNAGKVGSSATSDTGAQGEFSSSQTTTDPTTGATNTYTASGPTSGFLQGGALTTAQASPMGYSGGDVYVNYPGQTTNPATPAGQNYPPKNAPMAGTGQTGSWWYTLPKDVGAGDIANQVYQLGVDTSKAQSASTASILAADLVNIMAANPQIDWTRVTTGAGKLPAGTAIFVPLAGGNAGVAPKLPANASLAAPASYSPPAQQTSQSVPVSYVNN